MLYSELEFFIGVAFLFELPRSARRLCLLLCIDRVIPERARMLVHLYPARQAAVRGGARREPRLLPVVCEILWREVPDHVGHSIPGMDGFPPARA